MSVPKNVQSFWDAFQATVDCDASDRFYEVFHFDDNEPSANELLALVLCGTKRATAGLLWAHNTKTSHCPPLASSAWSPIGKAFQGASSKPPMSRSCRSTA